VIASHDVIIDGLTHKHKNTDNGLIIFAEGSVMRVIKPKGDKVGANAYYCDDHYHEPNRRIEGLVP
jgi:hypothetical protein